MARRRRATTTREAFARLGYAVALLRGAGEDDGPHRFAAMCETMDELIDEGSMRVEDAAICLSLGLGIGHEQLLDDLRRRYARVL